MTCCPTIETERLVLRPFSEDDTDPYLEVMLTPEVRASLRLPDNLDRSLAWAGMAAMLGLEIGWTFHPDHWGHGYATESGRAAVEWAWANHTDDVLYSFILPNNTPSQAVAQRLGFALSDTRPMQWYHDEHHGIWMMRRPSESSTT